MKKTSAILIVITTVTVGFILYFVIGMSSTYPPIKEYKFGIPKTVFDQKLADRIRTSHGWSLENRDSIKGKENEYCYWFSLFYQQNQQDLEYQIKYCVASQASNDGKNCLSLYVVGAFDYGQKSGGYKASDKDVEKLVQNLDRTLFNDLAPSCQD